MGAALSGADKWIGGVLGPDGKIYGIPRNEAADILIIDPDAGTATRSPMGASLSGTEKWIGGVLGPDGKIYGIPFNAADILIIDPDAGAFTVRIALDPRLNKF
jgi:phage shock protein PspC (stress-responsive transcriptional regulator)